MSVTIPQHALKQALTIVAPAAVAKSKTFPSFENVLLRWDTTTLLAITHDVSVEGTSEGMASVPVKALLQTARLLDGMLECSLVERERTHDLQLRGTQVEMTHTTLDPATEQHMDLPDDADAAWTVTLDAEALREAIRRVTFAAARENYRPALQCGYLELANGMARLTATDGWMLATYGWAVPDAGADARTVLLPVRAWNALANALLCGTVELRVNTDRNFYSFRHATTRVLVWHKQEPYPKWREVWNKVGRRDELVLDRAALLRAITRVSPYAHPKQNFYVRLHIADGWLTVHAANATGRAEAAMPVEHDGHYRAYFNSRLLRQALLHLPAPQVSLWLRDDPSAALLLTTGGTDDGVLLMPVSVRG
jgi:DNA polymerase III sliding clamp (beta) subunit (PCNA family)